MKCDNCGVVFNNFVADMSPIKYAEYYDIECICNLCGLCLSRWKNKGYKHCQVCEGYIWEYLYKRFF